jgi:hypothetical protein
MKRLVEEVDERITANEPCKFWEIFGAIFYALRINSLMVLGLTDVPFSDIILGAQTEKCDITVSLRPLLFRRSNAEFSKKLPVQIAEKGDTARSYDWKGVDELGRGSG